MASAFVDGALQDLKLLSKKPIPVPVHLRRCLENLRTFLLYARGSSGGGPMGSLLSRLEDSLIQNGKDLHNHCLGLSTIDTKDYSPQGFFQLKNCIESFSQEIMESYKTLSVYWSRQSKYPSEEFLRSLIVNLKDIQEIGHAFPYEQDPILIEAFKDQLVFFINFFRFAEFRGFEPCQLQVPVTRLHFVAVNAAILCFRFSFDLSNESGLVDGLTLKLSELLRKVQPIDPQIHETYVHILMTSNVSRSSHALTLETDKHVLGDFVDSLLWQNVEALSYGDSYMIPLKDQVSTILPDGLRFLRTILTKHLEKIDELHIKAKDLVGAAVNEAAIVICSLPVHEREEGLVKEIDFALHNFLERIKLIKVITSPFIFSENNEHGFIDFLLENLKELPSSKFDSIAFVKDQIQTVQEDLASLRSFWESVLDNRKHDGKLQSLRKRIVEVAHKTHSVILSLVVRNIPNCSPLDLRTIIEEINLIRLETFKIVGNYSNSDFEAQKATNTFNPLPSQGSTPAINKIMVTLHDEEKKIIEYLTGGSKKLDIISIVGMPGLGKTTLTRSVYDNPSVRELFHTSAWCVVSQAYKKKDLLLRILNSVDSAFSGHQYSKESEQELEEKLRKCLLRKRYLIILDDVWDIEAWNALKRSFPDNANSSRILLTSRDSEVAKKINPDREPHPLRRLENKECLDLLQKKLHCIKSYPLDLMEIAKACRGLPLTIVVVAGILSDSNQNCWEGIAKRLSSSALSDNDQCMDILELSFRKLPENLKSCLLYFGLFQEDQEISVRDLIWFWIAEGFIEKNEQKSLKDVAMGYMNDLISRNLVMVSRTGSMGGVKTCRIHELLYEFYVVKSKKEKFLSSLRGHDELFTFLGQRDIQRLSVSSTADDFVESKLSCPSVRSLLIFCEMSYCIYNISFIFRFFKLLKVLVLDNIDLGLTFPIEITLLVELRYLNIEGTFKCIPSAIANLTNLETLFVYGDEIRILLPDTIWNMPKLRMLRSNIRFHLCDLPIDKLDSSSALETFSTLELSFGQNLEKIMRKLPNICRLKCQLFKPEESNWVSNRILVMDFLSRLESLHLNGRGSYGCCIEFRFPKNLKKLTLSTFFSCKIPKGGEITNLVVLKLHDIHFEEGTWDMNEEWEFPNLKFLELKLIRIRRWTGIDDVDHFPRLEKLVLQYCNELQVVPSCFSYSTTLQMIEVIRCRRSVAKLIMQIKEDQKDNLGTEDLQVLIMEY